MGGHLLVLHNSKIWQLSHLAGGTAPFVGTLMSIFLLVKAHKYSKIVRKTKKLKKMMVNRERKVQEEMA